MLLTLMTSVVFNGINLYKSYLLTRHQNECVLFILVHGYEACLLPNTAGCTYVNVRKRFCMRAHCRREWKFKYLLRCSIGLLLALFSTHPKTRLTDVKWNLFRPLGALLSSQPSLRPLSSNEPSWPVQVFWHRATWHGGCCVDAVVWSLPHHAPL